MDYSDTIKRLQSELDQAKGCKQHLESIVTQKQQKVHTLEILLKRQKEARSILQQIAQQTQQNLIYKISDLVEACLNEVFDKEYKFHMNFVQKRNKTEVEMYLVTKEGTYGILDSCGGGIGDIVCFTLRIILWSLNRPKTDNVIILDEPFKFLSKGLQKNASAVLKKLSVKLGLQFIIVSHQEEIIHFADRVFTVTNKGGISHVEYGS